MRLIDVGGSLYNGMWCYGGRFPPVVIDELPPRPSGYRTYSYQIRMALHSSTYMETAAHLYPERINLDQLPLERCFLDALVLRIPRGDNEHVTAADLAASLAAGEESVRPGDAVIVNTGWYRRWDCPEYTLDSPHFTADAIDWVLAHGAGLLGSDMTRYDGLLDPQGHLARFFESDALMLACMTNLDEVRRTRVKLIALPIKIASCAAPARAVVVEE